MRDARRGRLRLFVYVLAAMAWIADGIPLAACKTLGMPGQSQKKHSAGRQAPISIGTRALTLGISALRTVASNNAAAAIAAHNTLVPRSWRAGVLEF